jgi:hypothetical protein
MREVYLEKYQVTVREDGQITANNGRIRKHMKCRLGYLWVGVTRPNGKRTTNGVHRLLAEAFIPNPENKPEVNHINGVKGDFSLINLEWATHKENIQHARRTGLFKKKTGHPEKALRNKAVSVLVNSGKFTHDQVAELFGFSHARSVAICRRGNALK